MKCWKFSWSNSHVISLGKNLVEIREIFSFRKSKIVCIILETFPLIWSHCFRPIFLPSLLDIEGTRVLLIELFLIISVSWFFIERKIFLGSDWKLNFGLNLFNFIVKWFFFNMLLDWMRKNHCSFENKIN